MDNNPDVMKMNLSSLKKQLKEQNMKMKELEIYKQRQETINSIKKLVDKLTLLQNEVEEDKPVEQDKNVLVLPTPTFTNNKTKLKKNKK